ncbi:MAG: hypothetical protein RDV48_23160 [Candidatus Eremiobacteraeota bacterium]|nr:hypothetical protein [Candidatus Eremiobacteraeota bacterium]
MDGYSQENPEFVPGLDDYCQENDEPDLDEEPHGAGNVVGRLFGGEDEGGDSQGSAREPFYEEGEIPRVTKAPEINELFAMGMLVLQGTLDPALFNEKLTGEKERFSAVYSRFLDLYRNADLPEELRGEAHAAHESFVRYALALGELESSLATGDLSLMESGLINIVNAVNELSISYESFIEKQPPPEAKTCAECASSSPLGTLQCSGCGALFLLTDEELPMEYLSLWWKSQHLLLSPGASTTPRSATVIYFEHERMARGDISSEKYVEEIDWLIAQFELTRKEIEKELHLVPLTELQAKQRLLEGINSGEKALEKLRDRIAWDPHSGLSKEWNYLLRSLHLIIDSQAAREGTPL